MSFLFNNIFHVALFVNDLEASLDFYKKLGGEVVFEIGGGDGEIPWAVYVKICEGQYVELQPVNSPNPHPHPEKSVYYDDQTAWHFSLETDNMVEVIDTLLERGITIYQLPDPGAKEVKSIQDVRLSEDGCFGCWVKDPDGTPIELMEQSKHSLQRLGDLELEKRSRNS